MTEPPTNPYAWSSPCPKHIVPRTAVTEMADRLQRGQTMLLHAGRGMGKSVLLHELASQLEQKARTCERVLIEGPKGEPLAAAILEGLKWGDEVGFADSLGKHLRNGKYAILLIDEIDAWVRPDLRSTTRATLDQLAKLSRETYPGQLGILVAGGVGNTLLTHSPWGSTFASRVDRTFFLQPFSEREIAALASKLTDRRDLPSEWLGELLLASGGIPALACQVLEAAWADDTIWPLDHLSQWIASQDGFRRAVRSSISVEEIQGTWDLLQAINQATRGELSAADADAAVGESLSAEDALRVLVSAGLVHPDYDIDADPWLVRPNPSVLNLGFQARLRRPSPLEALYADVRQACAELRRHSSDLLRGSKGDRKLVEEGTISAMVAMILRSRGWEADRETKQGPGRTDLRVHHRDLEGHVIVEVKIWGRNDFREVSKQLTGYALAASPRDTPTLALIAVVVAEKDINQLEFEQEISDIGPKLDGKAYEWQGEAEIHDRSKVPLNHILVSGLKRVKFAR